MSAICSKAERFYKNDGADETFAFSKNLICNVNKTNGFIFAEIYNPFNNDVYNNENVTSSTDRRILTCFTYKNNFYLLFHNTKDRRVDVYRNG